MPTNLATSPLASTTPLGASPDQATTITPVSATFNRAPSAATHSIELYERYLPPEAQTFEARRERLAQYHTVLSELQSGARQIDPTKGAHQRGAEVNLESLSPNIPVLVVGDLHGEIDNFRRILLDRDNLSRIAHGELVLVLQGDLIHPEHGDLYGMSSSLQLLELFMNLKIAFPHHVVSLVGNHDPIQEWAYKRYRTEDLQITVVNQADEFRQHLAAILELEGADTQVDIPLHLNRMAACTEKSPLYCVGKGFAVVHAGPMVGCTRDEMRSASPIDNADTFLVARGALEGSSLDTLDPERARTYRIYMQATWSRFESRSKSGPSYTWGDVQAFMHLLGQTHGALLVGHTPPKDSNAFMQQIQPPPDRDHGEVGTTHYALTASRKDALGYAVLLDGVLSFQSLS